MYIKSMVDTSRDDDSAKNRRVVKTVLLVAMALVIILIGTLLLWYRGDRRDDMQLHTVPADGDCLYHAVAAADDNVPSAAWLRQALGEYILTHRNEPRYTNRYDQSVISEVARRVATPGTWGESEELELLADMLNRCIAVHTPHAVQQFLPGVGQCNNTLNACVNPIRLYNASNVHFDAIIG